MADLWNSIWIGNRQPSQWQSNNALVKKHLERGADVNYHQNGDTCLMGAVRSQNKALVSLLLEQPGIDVNANDMFGYRALHMAAGRLSSPAIIRLLLDFPGIDGEVRNVDGRTPLMESIENGTAAQFAEFLKNTKNSAK